MTKKSDEDNRKQNSHPNEWDMLIGYQLLRKDMEKKKPSTGKAKSDSSWMQAILCTIGGLVLACIIMVLLGIDSGNVPAAVIVIMWMICAFLLMALVIDFESRGQ